jgi:hypothetical protein
MTSPSPLSRRSFLALSGGVVLLAACGSGDDPSGGSPGTTAGDGHHHDHDGFTDLSPGVLSSDLYATETPQRLAFAMLAKEGYASGGDVRLAVAPPGETPQEFLPTTLHAEGLPERRGVYVAEMTLPVAGVWSGIAERDGERIEFAFQVHGTPRAPVIGAAAPTAASPTPAAPLGVDPICTREPMCDLHERSLDTLIGAGRPVVVLFATPARCASQYCGPVLDTLLPLVAEFADRVDVVHVDIYRDLRSDAVSPTVEAWGLPSEPWLYRVEGDGTISARLDGAFGTDEIRAVLAS